MASKASEDKIWARLYQEVSELKRSLPEDAQAKHRGFSIFFAPPRKHRLLVLGLNPSRVDDQYAKRYPESELGPPTEHLYQSARGGELARALRSMLDEASLGDSTLPVDTAWTTLLSGTKINLIFFGSANISEWQQKKFWGSSGGSLRKKVEGQCQVWSQAICAWLSPTGILCEGFDTFSRFCNLGYGKVSVERTVNRPGREKHRLFVEGHVEMSGQTVPVLGILHPTGGRGRTKQESSLIGEALVRFCEKAI